MNFYNGQKIEIRNINTDNGLPQNSIKDIVKDKYGFIWLSTESGIVRYDGLNIINYEIKLANKRFGDFFGNVVKDSIFCINFGEDNTILINNKNFKKNIQNFSFKKFKDNEEYLSYPKNTLNNGVNLKANYTIEIGNDKYFIKKKKLIYISGRSSFKKQIEIATIDLDNIFGINQQLFFLNKKNNRLYSISNGTLSETKCEKLIRNKDSNFFWSSLNNQAFLYLNEVLYILKNINNKIIAQKLVYIPKSQIDLNFCSSLYYDSYYKKIYIGSLNRGLYIVSFSQFKTIQDQKSLFTNTFYAIVPFKKGILSSSGILYYTDQKKKIIIANSKSDKYALAFDSYKNILYKSDNKVYLAYADSNYRKIDSIMFEKYISFLSYEHDLSIIAFRGEKSSINFYRNQSFNKAERELYVGEEVQFAKFISKDSLLIGSRGGLYMASLQSGKIKTILKKKGLNVRSIFISKDHRIWILTYGSGLYLLENYDLIKMPSDSKKNLNECHTILEDSKGFFWITTNNGLFRIKEEELLKYKETRKYTPKYYLFDKSNGFITNEFNGGANSCGIILEDGNFAFPSLEGIVFFDPRKISTYFPNPDFSIHTAVINNKENKHFFNDLILERNTYRTSILVDIPYYGNPVNLVLQAKFNRSDAFWEDISYNKKFTFTSLPPGSHEILFRALISADGHYSYRKVLIIVKPYYYETLWFKLLMVFILVAIFICFYKLRILYLNRKNKYLEEIILEKTFFLKKTIKDLQETKQKLENESLQQRKLIGTISHDITTPIKYLALTTEMLTEVDDQDIRLKKKYLASLNSYALKLYKFTQTLKEYSKIYTNQSPHENNFYPINEIIKIKIALFRDVALSKNTVIINNASEYQLTNIGKNILAVIIHNLLDNAVKNTQDGNIYINTISKGPESIIEIVDEGIGIPIDKIDYYEKLQIINYNEKLLLQKFGLGLHLVIQLAQIINAKISFKINKPRGTIVSIKFKNK